MPVSKHLRYDSAAAWLTAGADIALAEQAIDVAMRATHVRADNLWRYVSGVVWKRLRERHDLARQYLDQHTED